MKKSDFIKSMLKIGWRRIIQSSLYPPPKEGHLLEGYLNILIYVNKNEALGVYDGGYEFIDDFDKFIEASLLAHKILLTEEQLKKIRYIDEKIS